ncbi:Transposon TX1 uncharacterized 149 kDa protein [Vitis vinifera]|uniref:Transposon TX1 uncharacterized 149 kDa protein n=1 Tax=Vitis vinifera TaxID=29760 RepID=A0A438HJV8_VITVI|nr:Transposon TX1 uncharacterized 149 kDa protein [Vitis vinifera]
MDVGSLADSLGNQPFKWGPTPFRFENMWLHHPSFKESFGSGGGSFKEMGGKVTNIANFDSMEQEGALSPELLIQRAVRKGELEELILREEIHWRQKARKSVSRLESPFTKEEISKAIFQMDRDKAPGPDGFTIAVFQDCWDVIKEDLVRVFDEFHRSGIINQSTNASFIVLLPKKSMAKKISDYRPISLITSLYKIIAKVLAGRLRGILHETIHSTQGAFVQGRQILDAVLIANEIVDEKKRSGEEGVVFKIDFEKAYDHVSWDFLDHVMEKKGFNPRWRKWIRGCLSSVSFAILVNGNAKGWVKASKDDTIFFSSTREEDLLTLKSVLLVFGHISGLKVNLDKSNIYGINLGQDHLHRLAEVLDCKASGWPILYLGLPLGGNPKSGSFWDPVIKRISSRLDGWQKAYLSFGGRITLIQSCLTHMPCYFLSLFKIPASVAGVWASEGFPYGIPLLREMVMEVSREGSALWHQVILSIYGSHSNGWDANTVVRWSHRCPWKAIAQVFQDFSKFTRFMVGDGERIRFWEDLWWGDQPLGVRFPRLLRVVMDKNIPISSILGSTRPFSWNFNFRRNLSNSDIEDLESLMRLFTVKSFFLALSQIFGLPSVFPTKLFWNSQVPFKIKSFVWLVAHKKGETVDHLFLHCPLTMGLWYRLFQLTKIDWVLPRSIFDMLSTNFNGFGSFKRGIALWQVAYIALLWVVWRERNARIFEDKTRNSENLWDMIHFLASLWVSCSKVFKGIPLNVIHLDWLAACNSIGLA